MTTDLLGSLKTYLTKLSDGEKTPQEVAAAINSWARESADSLKAKIHEEVEAAALKLGFVKREEFDALAKEVASLKKKATVKKSAAKKIAKKAPAKKAVKK